MSTELLFKYRCPYCHFEFSMMQDVSDLGLNKPEIVLCDQSAGGCEEYFVVNHQVSTRAQCCEILEADSELEVGYE